MLINCLECGLLVSDRALFCPHCGLPFVKKKKTINLGKKSRLPNGFGQISKINNPNLKRPYRAMVTVGRDDKNRPIVKTLKPRGYFSSYNEAYEALLQNAKDPYDVRREITIEELYGEWSREYFVRLSKSMVGQYNCAFKYCKDIYKTKINDLKPRDIKQIILDEMVPNSIKNIIKMLLNKMFDYAIENELSDKNCARITKIYYPENSKEIKHPHKAFSEEEIKILWQNSNDETVKLMLIQCYSGLRPGELIDLKTKNIKLEENYFVGGLKTKNGINRTIPIHNSIKELLNYFLLRANRNNYLITLNNKHPSYEQYRIQFEQTLERLSITKHTPHDCRKYFITTAKKYQVYEYAIKRIVGHQISDLTENVYTERKNEWLISEINKIIAPKM